MIAVPKHIAIIMDGNRRWARERNLDPKMGHVQGAKVIEKIVRYANKIGIEYITAYAFSTENWKRTEEEVGALMLLLKKYLDDFSKRADTDNIKIHILGDISKLPNNIVKSINDAAERTKSNTGCVFNIAFNYGGREEIVHAINEIVEEHVGATLAVARADARPAPTYYRRFNICKSIYCRTV